MEREDGTQLFLTLETGESAVDRLAAALAATPIPSVLLVPPAGQAFDLTATKQLVDLAQSKGAAALLFGDADLARQLGADGVHLQDGRDLEDRYRAARKTLGSNKIVGAHVSSRHDAMVLGEQGADYVAFGLLPEFAQWSEEARERQCELIAWWAELFEVPCVALQIGTKDEAPMLANAGADFVEVRVTSGDPLADVSEQLRSISERLAKTFAE